MEIWLETIDIPTIEKSHRSGILRGVITSPDLLAKTTKPQETLATLLAAQSGPVVVEAGGNLVEQGKKLHEFSSRIIVKVPVTEQNLEAIHLLSEAKIPILASMIFHPTQACLAALAGARWLAPSFSRPLTAADNPLALLESVKKMTTSDPLPPKILAVHPKSLEQIRSCLLLGIDAIAIREEVLKDLVEIHELTAHAIEQSQEAWQALSTKEWFF